MAIALRGRGLRRYTLPAQHIVWGGDRRERLLLWLLAQHYRTLHRQQWTGALPHFFDFRHAAFAFLRGDHGYGFTRGFYAAELVHDGDHVLDIGCGDGFLTSRFLAPRAAHVDAIDIDPSAIQHAGQHNPASNVTYSLLDATVEAFPRDRYDLIVLNGALGHLAPDASQALLSKIAAATDTFAGSESLGREGHDHLQFFESPADLALLLHDHFPHVQTRAQTYTAGRAPRHEVYWRCAHRRSSLAGWQ